MLHWSTNKFNVLHASALAGAEEDFFEQVESVKDDLASLLSAPSKSEASRATLAKGLVKFDDVEYSLNSEFLNTSAQISDELNLDELVAANLVFYSSQDASSLDLDPLESALSLFYVRRQYVVDLILYIAHQNISNDDPRWHKLASDVLGTDPTAHILAALNTVEVGLDDLAEKTKRGEFMGLNSNPRFMQLIKLQRDLLVREYEALSSVLYVVCSTAKFASAESLAAVIKRAAQVNAFDSKFVAYFAGAGASIALFGRDDLKKAIDILFAKGTSTWKLSYMEAALQLFLSARLCGEELLPFSNILDHARKSIDNSAVECLLALSQDSWELLRGKAEIIDVKQLVRQHVPTFQSWSSTAGSARVWANVTTLLETIAITIVTDLADILKEMRLSEEDMYLALAHDESAGESNNAAGSPGEDLERFFLFVSYLYRDRPDTTSEWWEDLTGPLGGFIAWSAECQASFMSATATEMIGSLACGQTAAEAASNMLSHPATQDPDSFILSWQSIYDVVAYYIAGLNANVDAKKQTSSGAFPIESGAHHHHHQDLIAATMHAKGPTAPASVGLDDDTVLVLSSYLRLVREIVSFSPEARTACRNENRDMVKLLFSLLNLHTPLTGAVLSTLASFSPVDAEDASRTWSLLDNWAFNAPARGPSGQAHFDELLTSLPDTLALLELLESLALFPGHRVVDYTRFVLNEVFVWASRSRDAEFSWQLQLHALQYTLKLSPKLVYPYFCERSVSQALFRTASIGIDALDDLPSDHPGVLVVTLALKLVEFLLPQGYEEQVLYHLEVVPHLALYAGSPHHPELAIQSLQLLSLLQTGEFFGGSSTRKSRLLSLLESVSYASRIRLNLAQQLAVGTPEAKIALLRFLASSTQLSKSLSGTPAQQLLGFKSSTSSDSVELDSNVGGVSTGTSLLSAVLALLMTDVAVMAANATIDDNLARTSRLCGEIFVGVLRDNDVKREILDWLRPQSYILNLLVSASTVMAIDAKILESEGAEVDFLRTRAMLLEVIAYEVEDCAALRLLGRHERYVNELKNSNLLAVVDSSFSSRHSLRMAQLACLRAWCRLVPLLTEAGDDFVLQIIRALVPRLATTSRDDAAFCGPVVSLLVLLFDQRPGLKTKAPEALFSAALLAIPPAKAFPKLRTDLYTVCYQLMLGSLTSQGIAEIKQKLSIVESARDNLVRTIFDDALNATAEDLCIVSLLLLQVFATAARRSHQAFMTDTLVRYNLLRPLLALALSTSTRLEVAKTSLALLLEISQSRVGARNLLWCGVLDTVDSALVTLRDRDHLTLLLALELVVSTTIAVGADDSSVTSRVRELLQHHNALVMAFLRADAANPDQLGESPTLVSQIAEMLSVLLAVTQVTSRSELVPEWSRETTRLPAYNL